MNKHTGSKTKNVKLIADTVTMSKKVYINYNLIIRARKVSLDYPIMMNCSITEFRMLKIKTMTEKHVLFDNTLVMRQRILGMVDIVDTVPLSRNDVKAT